MTRERFEFLKRVSRHFRENPSAIEYSGVSREVCFSLLSLYFSPPEKIIDPTAPDFLDQVEKKIGTFEKNFAQNQPLPETIVLPEKEKEKLETTVQNWQMATQAKQAKPLPPSEKLSQAFDGKLKNLSLQNFKKIKPEWASKISQFLGKGKFLGKVGGILGKVAGPIGLALIAIPVAGKIIEKAIKYLGGPLLALYMFFAALGLGAIIGAVVGAIAGGIAGAIAGAVLGAKIGAAIGAVVGGPIGAFIGGVAGGVVGTVVGGLAGAIGGMIAGGTLGYVIDHWVWQPIQGAWTGAGNFLGGAGNFLGGVWSGFWTGVGNFFSGLATGAGNFLSAAGGFLANLGAQFATLSLPTFHLVTIPIVGSVGAIFIGSYFTTTAIQRALIPKPPSTEAPVPPGSEYISLDKNGVFSSLGSPINYTLTLTAKDKELTNLRITDNTTFSCAGSPPSVDPQNFSLASLAPGASSTLNYQTPTTAQFNNCSVTNTATVRFDVPDDGKTDQTSFVSFTVTIGSPPASGCPVNNGVIFCGSYYTYDTYGCAHCDGGYITPCSPLSERAQAIDVKGPGEAADLDVYLPTLFGARVQWGYISPDPDGVAIFNGIFWGWEKRFQTTIGENTYGLRLLHINRDDPSLIPGQIYPSGERVGTIYNGIPYAGWLPHIHITASLNGSYLPADTHFHFCGG